VDEETRSIARIRLEKAQDDLKVARALIEQVGYRQAISRAYYAVFAIASAALLVQQIARKKHSGVESAFNQFLVKPGLIEPEYAAIYQKAFRARQEADYADISEFSESRARTVLSESERFVERIERYLREVGAI